MAQPKADKCPSSAYNSHRPCNCYLTVVLYLDEGDHPENSHVVFCPNKQHSLERSVCLDLPKNEPISEQDSA